MSLVTGILLYVLFLGIYWFFVLSILWHLKEYTMPIDYSSLIIKGFLGIMVILNLISLVLLFQLPFAL